MKTTRSSRAKLNSITTLANQVISTLCGMLIPRMMLGAFGSVLYGATTSISRFLSYISLLESGIGRVARAALYQPLADRDTEKVSRIFYAISRFFRYVAAAFVFYTIILAFFYFDIANVQGISRQYIFFLVIAISLSTVVDYLFGISSITLLNADQRKYVTNTAIIATRILNTLLVLILINMGSGIILVKLGSSIVIILRPVFLSWYVKKHYTLLKPERKVEALPQKWTGMAQHIAYFIHTNTDVVLLTIFSDLSIVAVYAVYSLITVSIKNIIFSLAGGMEAELGDMYARGEQNNLTAAYRRYHFIISMSTILFFGVTSAMIVPFVRLYTAGITDADYFQPVFALLLILGEVGNCLALPCSTLAVSCNELKRTQWGSFGEAIINIGFSCLLIGWNPLLGVSAGTLIAEVFKLIYYSGYASKKLTRISVVRDLLMDTLTFLSVCAFGLISGRLFLLVHIHNFFEWTLYAAVTALAALGVALLIGGTCYSSEWKTMVKKIKETCLRRI